MHYLDALNPMQRQAVIHTEGPLLIFAGAGSGKTRVLTYRIARLIEQGVDPFHIIAITFTNKAAREMRERVNHITPVGDQVWVSTFHTTCVRLLRREIHRLGGQSGFSIFDAQDAERLVKNCVQELNLDDKRYPARSIANIISAQKNELISPAAFERSVAGDFRMANIAEIYALYQRKLVSNNALDFDDIIFRTVELFDNCPDVLEKYQNRFRYVMVDEYQDTNTAQYRLIWLLSGFARNLCVVGDDDQSIYGWRGANIKNILRFEKDFPNAQVVKLEQNYRSTKTILDAANAVISHNFNRSEKKLWTDNDTGGLIHVHKAYNEGAEGAFVATTVKQGVANGAHYNDFAVLYRNNAQSRAVEDQLVMAGVPYRLYGGVRFYERLEVKDILSYLKAINNPADDLAYTRIINVPRRGIGATTLSKLQGYAAVAGVPLSVALRHGADIPGLGKKTVQLTGFADFIDDCAAFAERNPVTALIKKLLDETHYLESLYDGTAEGENRVENVRELISKAAEFEKNQPDNKNLAAFLEEVALVADIDNYEEGADTVALMTLHSAKGLEFNHVFIVGFEENIFPSSRSTISEDPDDLEEERRLCYVGFTRARRQLYVTHAIMRMQYGQTVSNAVSRFMKEIPREYIETVTPATAQRSLARQPLRQPSMDQPFLEQRSMEQRSMEQRSMGRPSLGRPSLDRSSLERRPLAARRDLPAPENKPLTFKEGDRVRQAKYGEGYVSAIRPAGADYEVTVVFSGVGAKKFMAHLSHLEKVE